MYPRLVFNVNYYTIQGYLLRMLKADSGRRGERCQADAVREGGVTTTGGSRGTSFFLSFHPELYELV